MTKRVTILLILVVVGVATGVFFIKRSPSEKAKVDSVAACVYDPSKVKQDCTCPFVSEGEKATTTCLIHDARGSLKIVDDRAKDGGIHLVLTDANGVMVNTPPINTWTGYGVKQIQKENNERYFVELASPMPQNAKLSEQNFRRYLHVSFSPKPEVFDVNRGNDLLVMHDRGKEINEEGDVYGFSLGKNLSKPTFVLTKINTQSGSVNEIVDLTTAVKTSGLLKQLQDPYAYWLDLSGGYNGLPFTIRAAPQGMTDELSRYYEVDVMRATLKQTKRVTW